MTNDRFGAMFSSHPVMAGAPAHLVKALGRQAVYRELAAGQLLCGNSERTGRVWFVMGGLLHATIQSQEGSPVTVDVLRPGQAFGYLNCFMEGAHTEDVSSLIAAEVVGVPAGSFLSFIHAHQPAARLLLAETAERMRGLMRLRAIATEPSDARVRSVLAFLNERMGSTIRMTRPMIAMVCGLTTETVTRSMAPLRRSKLIAVRRGRVEILDSDALGAPPKPR